LRECLALCKAGVPFDVAWSLDRMERLAWVVAVGENEGCDFDWHSMTWEKPR
jgi:hypothetical protein